MPREKRGGERELIFGILSNDRVSEARSEKQSGPNPIRFDSFAFKLCVMFRLSRNCMQSQNCSHELPMVKKPCDLRFCFSRCYTTLPFAASCTVYMYTCVWTARGAVHPTSCGGQKFCHGEKAMIYDGQHPCVMASID